MMPKPNLVALVLALGLVLAYVVLCGPAVRAATAQTPPQIERYDVDGIPCYVFTVRGQVAVWCAPPRGLVAGRWE